MQRFKEIPPPFKKQVVCMKTPVTIDSDKCLIGPGGIGCPEWKLIRGSWAQGLW